MANWIQPFLKARGITSELGPCAARDQHGNEYEMLVIPFVGGESEGRKFYKKSLIEFMRGHVHIIWRHRPRIETDGKVWKVYSRLSRYPERP